MHTTLFTLSSDDQTSITDCPTPTSVGLLLCGAVLIYFLVHSRPGHSRPIPENTEKLELPSLSQVHTRGPADVPWYNHHSAPRSLLSSDRLPNLPIPNTYPSSTSSGTASRIGSLDSSSNYSGNQYPSSLTSASSFPSTNPSSGGLKSPSPPVSQHPSSQPPVQSTDAASHAQYPTHGHSAHLYHQDPEPYSSAMNPNHQPQYLDSQSHMSAGPPYAPQPQTTGGMSHYPQQYQQQAPALQPGHGPYAQQPAQYGQYGYPTGVTSPQSGGQPASAPQINTQLLPLPVMPPGGHPQHPYPSPGGPAQSYSQPSFDATGQIAPPGMKPRVTATLWEDEGTLCFQVEAKGVCVARRDDNHMINGTKLLNVAGMTRGRRDGILKSEKTRHVVKIGPMHLKGVWIPFERALDFANREKITELLYPLFVHNIGAMLYHPTNANRTNMVMQAAERRQKDEKQRQQSAIIGAPGSQATLHHHHSMNSQMPSHVSQSAHSIAPHPGNGRPSLDRAHTFPTPPTSASSIIGNQSSEYGWNAQAMSSGVQGGQPLSIDTGLSNTRSMPTTPATTPPGSSLHSMQSYQNQQSYDSSRPLYTAAPPQHSPYVSQQNNVAQQNLARFGQPAMPTNIYMKNEMGPPTSRTTGSGDGEHADIKADPYTHGQGNEQVGHGTGEEEAEHEHDAEYAHDSNAAYANRGPPAYYAASAVGSIPGEHPHLSSDQVNGSPSHQSNSGRGTPRTTSIPQPQWAPGYGTGSRAPPPSNLNYVMSDARGSAANGTNGADSYTSPNLHSGYAPSAVNGTMSSHKRGREEDEPDHSNRPMSGGDMDALKRRKTGREGSISTPTTATFDRDGRPMSRTRSNLVQQRAR